MLCRALIFELYFDGCAHQVMDYTRILMKGRLGSEADNFNVFLYIKSCSVLKVSGDDDIAASETPRF